MVVLPVPVLLMEPKQSDGEALGDPSILEKATAMDRAILDGLRVLVVEDELDGREMLVAVFEGYGAHVSAVASAAEAMEALERAPPHILICDIGLPGEDGHELMRRIRALEAKTGGRIPALALTAYAGIEDRRRALAAGFDLHVPKPAAPSELVAKAALLASGRDERGDS